VLGGQVAEGDVHRHAVLLGHLRQVVLAFLEAGALPGLDRAFGEVLDSSGMTSPKSTPITRPKPRQVSQAPMGELKENRLGVGVGDVAVGAVQAGAELPAGFRVARHAP
jgi:hypothetical protein